MEWVERLRCPKCAFAGNAELFEVGQFGFGVRKLPEGFKLFAGPFGEDFHCATCGMEALTSDVKYSLPE